MNRGARHPYIFAPFASGHADHQRPDGCPGIVDPHVDGVPGSQGAGYAGQNRDQDTLGDQPETELPGHSGHEIRPQDSQQPTGVETT